MPSQLKGKLTVDRLRCKASLYPKLKAKAAATRCLVKYALSLVRRFHDGSKHDDLKLAMCERLVTFYDIMKNNSQFFPNSVAAEFAKNGREMCVLYSLLYTKAYEMGVKAWKMVPKAHLVCHMCEHQAPTWGNPSYWWCYADEDLVGLMIEVARSCHVNTLAATALVKWLILAFDADDDDDDGE